MISLKNCYHLELVPKLTDEMNNSIPLHSSISLLSLKPKPLNCRLKLNSHLNISSTISNSISNAKTTTTGAIIIGGGLAGLAAATKLNSNNIPFLLIESSDGVGGRVRTDVLDGFLLDRGFQIFITAYPHARQLLNYDALDLQKFYSGARIFVNHAEFHTVADPLRHFIDSVNSLTNPIGSVLDKLLIAGKRIQVLSKSDQEILCSNEEVPTLELLKSIGFSDTMISRFFRPFFGGIFFDPQLQTTSKLFDFIFKCLALGDNTLPSKGIGAIPLQLASKLPPDSILLNTLADSIDVPDKKDDLIRVVLENGEVLQSELGVIVAVEQPQLRKLFPHALPSPPLPPRSTVCLYFSAEQDQVPSRDPILYLNGSSKGIINNMFFPTNVAPSYAPPGKALISVSLIGLFEHLSNDDLSAEVLRELSGWFGESMVQTWKHLRTYRIPFAQPNQCPPTDLKKGSRVESGLYLCGDHLTSATFDGALLSGTRAAEALLSDNNAVSTIANPARVAYL